MKKGFLLLLLAQLYTLFASDLLLKINYANHDDALEIARKNNLSVHHINLDYMLVKSNKESLTKINKLFNSVEILDNNLTSENYYIIPKKSTQLKRTATTSLDNDNYLIKNLTEDEYWSLKKELIKVNSISKEPITLSANKITRMPTLPKDEKIAALVEKVDQDSLRSYMQQLQNFKTRYAFALNRREVAVWIQNKFKSFGYENARLDSFQMPPKNGYYLPEDPHPDWQYNVEASLTGTKYPENILVIGGHHDSGPISSKYLSYETAPGADDNGSGTSAVLEVARILKQNGYIGQKSLKFCTWAAEEVGSHNNTSGSYQYAKKAKENKQNIELYINNDMIANYYNKWEFVMPLYTNSFTHREFTKSIIPIYTSLKVIDGESVKIGAAHYFAINSGGDGNSFFQNGFNSTYFTERDVPFDRYHELTDVVDSCNFPYFKETTKANIANLLSYDKLTPAPTFLKLSDIGNSTVKAEWNKITSTNIKGYNIYVGDSTGKYLRTFYANTNYFSLTDLNFSISKKYYIGISAVDLLGKESCINEAEISLVPLPPQSLNGVPTKSTIKLMWNANKEVDIAGYNIYRSIDSLNFTQINSTAIKDTFFVDQEPILNQFNFYKATTIDKSQNESIFSTPLKSHAASLNKGILVRIPYQYSGSNEYIDYIKKITDHLPNVKIDDSYYNYDANILGQYNSLIILDSYSDDDFKEYLNLGGNVLLLGDLPYNLKSSSVKECFGIDSVLSSKYSSRCFGAEPVDLNFPKLSIDTTKTSPVYDYHIYDITTVLAHKSGNIIYKYDSKYDISSEYGEDKGKTIGLTKVTSTYKTALLTLPIDMLKESQVKGFLTTVIDSVFNKKSNSLEDPSTLSKETILLQNYPNPFNPTTQIEFSLAKEEFVNLSIYNIKGELVQELINQNLISGKHNINFNGAGLNSGVYLYRLKTGKNNLTQKMVIVK